MYLCIMEIDRDMREANLLCKIESIRKAVVMMSEEGDIKHLAKIFLMADLDSLEMQVTNLNQPYKEIEK